ncbi:hypothetical protein JYG23_02545 [Sedimentibacter sp. zth1]|uniref:hypothetical protein n=1 Tax=Sedimentibacter sp. zth1 TaxID=2816908 RepID=UPI001A9186B4|nr:hypothetical protein [Sedimentibacter sp. zth1]QSX06358.1 hypothetical protein JYG23_02545 [Sedimentibacter sp. zth1]
MKDSNFEKLQKLYEQGYRCIRYDDVKDEKMNIYLQNFDIEEKTKALEVLDFNEKVQVIDFINKNNLFK